MNLFFIVLFILKCGVLYSFASDTLDYSELELNQGVKYLSFTRANRNNAVDIRKVTFDDNYSTVFVIHGFETTSLDKPLQVKNDLFQLNLNVDRVIIVSWLDYSFAAGKLIKRNF